MEEPIKMPEPCCASCEYGRYNQVDTSEDNEDGYQTNTLTCINEHQTHSIVKKWDYCFYHEYPF